MTEQEVSVRLTENDERLYACAKRLEAVERRQDALDKLVTAVEVLAVRQESVEGNVKEIRNAVQSITEKAGEALGGAGRPCALSAARRGILLLLAQGRRHEKKVDIFKLLLLLESAVVLYTTYEGLRAGAAGGGVRLSRHAAVGGGDGERRLGAYGASVGFITTRQRRRTPRAASCLRPPAAEQVRSGQDCDGWEENG